MNGVPLRNALLAVFGNNRFDKSRVARAAETDPRRLATAIKALVPHPTLQVRLPGAAVTGTSSSITS
jgi:hypothetical protein